MQITVIVNAVPVTREIEPRLLLIHFLRDDLGLTGSHWGCDTSNCGACVVWLDETPVKSCTVLAAMADGHRVRTVEGMGVAGRHRRQHGAGLDRRLIEPHHAGAAVGGVTAPVRAGQAQLVAQEVNEQQPRFDLPRVFGAVDG